LAIDPGFDDPNDHLAEMMKKVPPVGAPRDRQLVVTTHEMAVNELKDHGFPYAKVATAEEDGPDGKNAKMTHRGAGQEREFRSVEISGNKTVALHHRAEPPSAPIFTGQHCPGIAAPAVWHGAVSPVNIEPPNPELQPEEIPRATIAKESTIGSTLASATGRKRKGGSTPSTTI
jgi:hypothetical protein